MDDDYCGSVCIHRGVLVGCKMLNEHRNEDKSTWTINYPGNKHREGEYCLHSVGIMVLINQVQLITGNYIVFVGFDNFALIDTPFVVIAITVHTPEQ